MHFICLLVFSLSSGVMGYRRGKVGRLLAFSLNFYSILLRPKNKMLVHLVCVLRDCMQPLNYGVYVPCIVGVYSVCFVLCSCTLTKEKEMKSGRKNR